MQYSEAHMHDTTHTLPASIVLHKLKSNLCYTLQNFKALLVYRQAVKVMDMAEAFDTCSLCKLRKCT